MLIAVSACMVMSALARAQLKPSPTFSPPSPAQGTVSSTASPNPQWGAVLGDSLWFYDAQRSGNLSEGAYGNRVSWRNNSAMEDGSDYGVDLSGGWYDAGDWIKATFPLGFTMWALAWGALSYGPGYAAGGQTAYLDGSLRWGYDWLMKAHPSDDVLFVQIGAAQFDSNASPYWGIDSDLPSDTRVSYPVNSSSPGTDVWASTAGAFALGALAYQGNEWNTSNSAMAPAGLNDTSYADKLLGHAKALYKVAMETSPQQTFSDSVQAISSAYPSSGFGDDLATAALALAAATNDPSYYSDAYQLYGNYTLSSKGGVWNWDSRAPALYVLFAEISVARPGLARGAGLDVNVTGWQQQAEWYFDEIIDGKDKDVFTTPAGLLFFRGDSDQASLNPAMAFTALLLRYAPIASSQDKTNKYVSFAQGQIDYVMGKNPMNVPYMVGIHPNSPKAPHVVRGSGITQPDNIREPPENAETLYGAVPGGPRPNDLFWPWRDDWVQSEIALDYNANFPALAAYQLATNASDPYYVQVAAGTYRIPSGEPCDAALPCGQRISGGAIAGIVIGVIAAIVIAALLVWCWLRGPLGRRFKR